MRYASRPSIAEAFADAYALYIAARHLRIHHLAVSYLARTRTEAVRHHVMIALPMPAPFIGAFCVPVISHGDTMGRLIETRQFAANCLRRYRRLPPKGLGPAGLDTHPPCLAPSFKSNQEAEVMAALEPVRKSPLPIMGHIINRLIIHWTAPRRDPGCGRAIPSPKMGCVEGLCRVKYLRSI
jgi:hypothetical protein